MLSENDFCPVGARVRVLSRHRTSEGEVRYLRCDCGVIRLVVVPPGHQNSVHTLRVVPGR
ncbi:hypothetical protein FHX82_003771 [Amycolatopsis bartoniae]|nr:hypothetical protein [Amycolatopsis bartoniae]MBB2936707.1 hypothetical protein [Amycolatopsis bartoniae]TVS99310.1 hypothetical protein FNH07_35280 [Amycolatopsis bartoniae]